MAVSSQPDPDFLVAEAAAKAEWAEVEQKIAAEKDKEKHHHHHHHDKGKESVPSEPHITFSETMEYYKTVDLAEQLVLILY